MCLQKQEPSYFSFQIKTRKRKNRGEKVAEDTCLEQQEPSYFSARLQKCHCLAGELASVFVRLRRYL